jgi:hypothetical protein
MTDEEKVRVMTSEAAPPPWVDEEYDEGAADLLREHICQLIRDHAGDLAPLTREQELTVVLLMTKSACWGWDAAHNIGPMAQRYASPAAAAAKQASKARRYSEIRAAFDAAAAAGREPDINELAAQFSVSRPTVYRALRGDQ